MAWWWGIRTHENRYCAICARNMQIACPPRMACYSIHNHEILIESGLEGWIYFFFLKYSCQLEMWIEILSKNVYLAFIRTADFYPNGGKFQSSYILKFKYFEKVTKFCKIFTLILFYVVTVKSKVKILWPSQNIWTLLKINGGYSNTEFCNAFKS